ncbi:MAG: ABC transporter ATP-binding protein [Gallionella sp.]|nr:ABC transporter ATP-binding protein [Gallionella sp.]MDD4959394.1 ABC transporter ATP-binding protein [Gallionella sp.]
MTESVITVKQLGKAFKRYARIRHRLLEWLPGGGQHHELRWVLNDLNFSICQGESVGLVGRNGAGKSTLLKLLTGILIPTTGEVHINGRVAALLELGMGFHPELSGYDNVLMAGQLQGLSRDDVLACMDSIVAFAEIGDALQQPVRTYSSGMMVRLAFATATAVRPDVLIVDEALAVGDAYFQHKCFRRIREFREQGATLLFVSHDPMAVKSLCNRALLIESGRIAIDGDPVQVLDYYNALIALDEAKVSDHALHIQTNQNIRGVRSGTGEAQICSVRILRQGRETQQVTVGEALDLVVDLAILQDLPDVTLGVLLRDRLGNEIFGINTHQLGLSDSLRNVMAHSQIVLKLTIDHFNLGVGSYSLTVAAHGADSHLAGNYDWWDQALVVEVGFGSGPRFGGVVHLPVSASVVREVSG